MNETHPQSRNSHHSSMLRRFGWFHKLLGLGRTLKRLDLDRSSVRRIRDANQKGPIIYVLLRSSNLDYLALNHVLNERRLPLSVWANGVSHRLWKTWPKLISELVRRLQRKRSTVDPQWISKNLQEGQCLTVCLEAFGRKQRTFQDVLPMLLSAQKQCERPIQLIPVVVVWKRAPKKWANPSLRFLMDRTRISSTFGQITNVIVRSRRAFVQVGEPVALPELMDRVPEPRQSRALRILLRRYLKRETNLIRGPRLLTNNEMMELVLNNAEMRELARSESIATRQTEAQVRRKMEREYTHIAARFRYWMIPILDLVLRPLWTKVYSGVDIPPADMERIRSAMRKGSIVLVPCHKSHFDYVLLSWVFFDHKLIIPHIVAGANLAIPGLSWILRRAGGFFIKRSFAGERLHPKIFARYLRELTRLGYPVEFYIEGGRTRSGKLTNPKLGVLGMVLDAAAIRPSGQEITFLPLAIAYDRVAEQKAYAKELGGASKQQESLGQFAKATGVLRNRYGRVYIRVGEPLCSSDVVDTLPNAQDWPSVGRLDRKEILQRTGEDIIHRIGAVSIVLPSTLVAMSLLAHHRRGLKQSEMQARLNRFRDFLKRVEAPFAKTLERFEEATAIATDQFAEQGLVESLTIDGERIWSIEVNGRVLLDYYKNHCLHYFVQAGFAAAAIRGIRRARFQQSDLMFGFTSLHWMMRKEFVLDPNLSLSTHLKNGLAHLVAHGAIREIESHYEVCDEGRISEIYGLFRSLLEAYWIILKVVDDKKRTNKEVIKALHHQKEDLISTGQITRPEAVTEMNLKNALKSFQEDGVLESDKKERLGVNRPHLKTVMTWLNPMVNE